jgi:hypothetical protein
LAIFSTQAHGAARRNFPFIRETSRLKYGNGMLCVIR